MAEGLRDIDMDSQTRKVNQMKVWYDRDLFSLYRCVRSKDLWTNINSMAFLLICNTTYKIYFLTRHRTWCAKNHLTCRFFTDSLLSSYSARKSASYWALVFLLRFGTSLAWLLFQLDRPCSCLLAPCSRCRP